MTEEQQYLSTLEALGTVTTKLKQVLNPKPIVEQAYCYKITTDAESLPLCLEARLQSYDSTLQQNNAVVLSAFIDSAKIVGKLSGVEGVYIYKELVDDKYVIYFGSTSTMFTLALFEIFELPADIKDNQKNRITEIEVVDPEDIPEEYVNNILEDTNLTTFTVTSFDQTGEPVTYTIPTDSTSINKIFEAYSAEVASTAETAGVLSNDIDFTIYDTSNTEIGSGTLEAGETSVDITIDLSDSIPDPYILPQADSNTLGGIKLVNQDEQASLSSNDCPVKKLSSGAAYVTIPKQDIHRFTDMSLAPKENGLIVQYIGETTGNYIFGYFYQYIATLFQTITLNDTGWRIAGTQATTKDLVNAFNEANDYVLVDGYIIKVTYGSTFDSVTDDTILKLSYMTSNLDEVILEPSITYADIKTLFGIELISTAVQSPDSTGSNPVFQDLQITVSNPVPESAEWVQKNVQPITKMQSALTYKGVKTWAELQLLSPTAQPGDFYTVSDRSYQEYFWNGSDWEFMGDVFTANGKYQVKTKVGSADPVTVSEFEANQSDTTAVTLVQGNNVTLTSDTTNHTIEIAATDTQADWNETNTSSPAYINNKPSIPAAQVQTDWNASAGMGVLLNKPSLDFLPLAGGTLTGQVYYNESGTSTTAVACTKKYNFLTQTANTITLTITAPSSLEGPCEVIYAVKNGNVSGGSNITLTLPTSMTGGTVHNMTGEASFTIAPQKIAELVFTFWSTTEVSFNGGVEP